MQFGNVDTCDLAQGNHFGILKLVIRINEPGEKRLDQCLVPQRPLGSRSGEAGHSPRAGQAHPMIPYCLAGCQDHCSLFPPRLYRKVHKVQAAPTGYLADTQPSCRRA